MGELEEMGEDKLLLAELYDWLNELDLSKPKKNVARDFSDAVLLAEILKKEYPRLVELHNYFPANSFRNKLTNWITLNDKVLYKIGLGQTSNYLKELANANKEAVERLLLSVKRKLEEEKEKNNEELYTKSQFITEDGQVLVDLRVKSTVPYEDFKRLEDQLIKKDEELESLQSKISHIEALLSLKDQRLQDLVAQIKRCNCHKI